MDQLVPHDKRNAEEIIEPLCNIMQINETT